jgi:hypothetical protein
MEPGKKYDVAISFLAEDEPLARRLGGALPGLKVFVYSKQQEQLAGTDGLESFREVFRHRARIVVVLYRPRWGQTRWTNVEEIAIKEFCLDRNWPRLVFVVLEKGEPPRWLPETNIRFNYDDFGFDELVGAVKARCLDAGVQVRAPTAVELAKAAAEEERFQAETEYLIRNSPGPLRETAAALFASVERRMDEIERDAGMASYRGSTGEQYVAAFTPDGPSLQLLRHWRMGLERTAVVVYRLWSGRYLTPAEQARGGIQPEAPKEIRKGDLNLTRAPELGWCWKNAGRVMPTEAAAEFLVGMLVTERARPATT